MNSRNTGGSMPKRKIPRMVGNLCNNDKQHTHKVNTIRLPAPAPQHNAPWIVPARHKACRHQTLQLALREQHVLKVQARKVLNFRYTQPQLNTLRNTHNNSRGDERWENMKLQTIVCLTMNDR